MSKTVLVLLISLVTVVSHAEPRSFDFTLTPVPGKELPAATQQNMMKFLSQFVAEMKVRNFYLKATPPTGGFHVCIDPVEQGGYDYIFSEIQTVSVGGQGIWDIQLVERCKPEPKHNPEHFPIFDL